MFQGLSVCVVIPAYNEEKLIARTVSTLPDWVDAAVVVDDASTDRTAQVLGEYLAMQCDSRVTLLRHEHNSGVGASIVTGYRHALRAGFDVAVVMAGDAQMDAVDLPAILAPLTRHEADYVKGNRLCHRDVKRIMPLYRYYGNHVLTLMTRWVTGYRIVDSQCGYTAITREAMAMLDLDALYPRYGFPNDILVQLSQRSLRVMDVPVKPVYGEAVSNIRLRTYIPTLLYLLSRGFFRCNCAKLAKRDATPATQPRRAADTL